MEQIIIEGMADRLDMLGVAQEQLAQKEEDLEYAEMSYRFAIEVLEMAMETDPAVVEAREKLATMRQIESDAVMCVSKAAIFAWQDGLTDDRKEWAHGNWEIRLRTTRTPIVTQIKEFVAHLIKADATALINTITLHKKDTLNISDTIKLSGLRIEEKTTCSVKKCA